MRIVTFNVNSIKARLDNVREWLAGTTIDVLMLQELKGESFPEAEFKELGFVHQLVQGQKAYNGVALLSRTPITDTIVGLPGDDSDPQARFVGGTINGVRCFCLYLPNGNPKDTEKFPYKLGWMERLYQFAKIELAREMPVVFGGDYNVIPQPEDAKRPEAWVNDALFSPEARGAFERIKNLGYTEAFRTLHPTAREYSFWDYQAGALQKNDGIRIDHFLLSPEAADRLLTCRIDKAPRMLEKASDHTPVILELSDAA